MSRYSSSSSGHPRNIDSSGGGGGGSYPLYPASASSMVPPQHSGVYRHRHSSIPHSESFSTTDPAKLNDLELDCLKEAFSLFDANHDGEYWEFSTHLAK